MESYQRSQALTLVQDMVDRLTANSSQLRADINHGTALTTYKTTLNTTDVGAAVQTCSEAAPRSTSASGATRLPAPPRKAVGPASARSPTDAAASGSPTRPTPTCTWWP